MSRRLRCGQRRWPNGWSGKTECGRLAMRWKSFTAAGGKGSDSVADADGRQQRLFESGTRNAIPSDSGLPPLRQKKVARMGHGALGYSNHGAALAPCSQRRGQRMIDRGMHELKARVA